MHASVVPAVVREGFSPLTQLYSIHCALLHQIVCVMTHFALHHTHTHIHTHTHTRSAVCMTVWEGGIRQLVFYESLPSSIPLSLIRSFDHSSLPLLQLHGPTIYRRVILHGVTEKPPPPPPPGPLRGGSVKKPEEPYRPQFGELIKFCTPQITEVEPWTIYSPSFEGSSCDRYIEWVMDRVRANPNGFRCPGASRYVCVCEGCSV